jgi:recombinational DNA repair protein (RecF pathway)
MRHKYETQGIVLARVHTGEATTLVTILTPDLGLVQARAQSLRNQGAKLAASLATLVESRVVLVHGKEGWRVTGAVLEENWFVRLPDIQSQEIVARVSGLLLRLVAGEAQDVELFPIVQGFLGALATLPSDLHEAVEILTVLRVLRALGLDAGEIPVAESPLIPSLLSTILENRMAYVTRINNGIAASGL